MTRVLPHSLEAERAILGGILLHPRAFADVQGHVSARDFHHPAHEAIFNAIVALDAASKPIDSLTVAAQMRADDTLQKLRALDGELYFAALTDAVVTIENIAFHAQMVAGKATVRRTIEAATEIAVKGFGDYGDLDEYLGESARAMDAALDSAPRIEPQAMRAVQREAMHRVEARYEARGALVGVPSGMRRYDEGSGGWHETELAVVAARPGVGKTAWAMFAAYQAARAGVPVLFVSLEMDRLALHDRLAASVARVEAMRLRTGKLEPDDFSKLVRSASAIATLPLWIDDETSQTIATIRGKVRRWRMKTAPPDQYPKALVFVDYLQLIAGNRAKNTNRAEEVGTFSVGLKNLARELRIPVVALAQLNRQVEARGDKRPTLSDLRESGSIEQDADIVAFLHRPALYDEKADRERADLLVAKNRSGACGTVALRWQEQFTRYSDEANS